MLTCLCRCFQTDAMDPMPITRKTSSPKAVRKASDSLTTASILASEEDKPEEKDAWDDGSVSSDASHHNNGNGIKNKFEGDSQTEQHSNERKQELHNTDELLDAIFNSDTGIPVRKSPTPPPRQSSTSAPTLPATRQDCEDQEQESLRATSSGQWLSSSGSKTGRGVSIGCRRRSDNDAPTGACSEPKVPFS